MGTAKQLFAQQNAQFQGLIFDEQQTPLSGVSILITPDHELTKSDNQGSFILRKLFTGTYTYTITAIGYQTKTGTVELHAKDKKIHHFQLQKSNQVLDEVAITKELQNRPSLIDSKNSAMPVTIIDRKAIELMGSRRLDEVLKEQTGIAIVSNTAGGNRSVGVQLQGFSSEYVMILIDGQPMLGRSSGNFDLSRISVSNIERIEIIKGASSCLYGSEALGGAINIITRLGKVTPQLHANVNYGSSQVLDATIEGESSFNKNKGTALLSTNYYRTDGFNTNKDYQSNGTTIPPYQTFSIQGKVRHQLKDDQHFIGASGRYNYRHSDMLRAYGSDYSTLDQQKETDINASLFYDSRWNDRWRSLSTYYLSHYSSDNSVTMQESNTNLTSDNFAQMVHRLEQQFAYQSDDLNITMGVGGSLEAMEVKSSFDSKDQNNFFLYAQANKTFGSKTTVVTGLRYDQPQGYGGKLNPSFGITYQLLPQLALKTGIGTGFKAPDFKTRYQVFYNPAANYYVIGNEVLRSTIDEMDANGQISERRTYIINQLDRNLQAERNTSINAGITWKPMANTTMDVNVFHHQLRNQINSIQVATGMQNMAIFSYQNLPKSVNKGFDVSISTKPLKQLTINAGYQYLISKDMSIADSIKQGSWPYNSLYDAKTGNSYTPNPKDYWGLENRSRHQFNIGAIYQAPWNITINARANFRGKYAFGDANGNHFIDRYDVFVNQHVLYNATIEKKFDKLPFTLRLSGENLSNYLNYLIPGQMGRSILMGVSYRITK
ncbi:TonB-dependent receptor [Sphingobacterium faecium]|uniref:TonB-dependent receptor n=1 Tax=Sphingobacterium faecium TaxID=34087 RepID=UPI002469AB70|nr:TonB-dependent receptor [Sphingobacterium faecium]MDH5826182.1 TonB-dependent receptor [Sphingobacterium faecium]